MVVLTQNGEDVDACIQKENEYGNEQIKLNQEIYKIIKSNFQYADIDDHNILKKFVTNHLTRLRKSRELAPVMDSKKSFLEQDGPKEKIA